MKQSYELIRCHNLCLVVTDGSVVLGLGDIDPESVMDLWQSIQLHSVILRQSADTFQNTWKLICVDISNLTLINILTDMSFQKTANFLPVIINRLEDCWDGVNNNNRRAG